MRPATVALSATREWAGDEAFHAQFRTDVTLTLERSADGKTWEPVPGAVAYTYRVVEAPVPFGYAVSYSGSGAAGSLHAGETLNLKVTNTFQTAITITQNWDDFSNKHQTRPDEVHVSLMAGADLIRELTISGTGNVWTFTEAGLPRVNEQGEEILYTVSMEPVSGYEMTHTDGSFVFDHTLVRLQDIPVAASWTDNEDAFGIRPDGFTIELWAQGTKIRSARIGSDTDWKALFEDVPIYDEDDGTILAYTLQAISADGYSVTLTPDGNGFRLDYVGSGALTVSKTVEGSLGERDRYFHFTVTMSDPTLNGTYGGMTFAAGVAEFTLKHGESITATGLPAEASYTVTEAEANRYGYTTKSQGTSGTIETGRIAAAAFVNRKDAPILPQTGQLNWPIPVLLGSGILLLILGSTLGKKKRR